MNDIKNVKEILNSKEIEKETNTFVSNLDKIQKGITSSTSSLKDLQSIMLAHQEILKSTNNSSTSALDTIKKIILVMDTLQTITSKLKNVGRGKMFPLIQYYLKCADLNMCSSGY